MTKQRKLKAVFFDLDDTLVPTTQVDAEASALAAALLAGRVPGLDPARLLAAWRVLFKKSPWDPNGKVEVEAWRGALWAEAIRQQQQQYQQPGACLVDDQALGAEAQACFSAARHAALRFLDGVAALVQGLRAQGYAIAMITNGHHAVQRAKLAACAAHGVFDPGMIIIGGEEELAGRRQKPHAGIFHRACQLVGVDPGEAVMVGDSLEADVAGGIAAGLGATVWVDPGGGAPPPGAPRPSAVVRSVLELPRVLAELEAAQRCGE